MNHRAIARTRVGVVALFLLTVVLTPACSSAAISGSVRPLHSRFSKETGRVAIPSDTELTIISFINVARGYGVFTDEGALTCTDGVGNTSNGGATFSVPIAVVAWRCANSAPVSSLAFDARGDGFLYGPKLYVSHDGGVTWSPSHQRGAVLSVEAVGDSIWMLGTSRPVPSSATNGSTSALRLLTSTNGGRTWTAESTPRGAVVQSANVMGSGWLVRINRTSAYLTSSPRVQNGRQVDATPLWFTTDSGATWTSRSIPCSSFGTNVALSAAPDGTLFDVCAGQPGTGMQLKETVRSTNRGRTWQVRSVCRFSNENSLHCTLGSQTSGYLGEIDAVSSSTVYLVGGRSSLDVSRDGGVRWSVVPPGLGSSAGGTSQVVFFGTSTGVVLGDSDRNNERLTLWITTDGGAHWIIRVPKFA